MKAAIRDIRNTKKYNLNIFLFHKLDISWMQWQIDINSGITIDENQKAVPSSLVFTAEISNAITETHKRKREKERSQRRTLWFLASILRGYDSKHFHIIKGR